MEGLRFSRSDDRRMGLRSRIVLLVILPVAFLGVAGLLFNEYVLERAGSDLEALRLTLRLGGAGLLFLALVLAAACGYLLAEQVSRPIRLLLRLAEEGEISPGRASFLERRGREVFQLYRLVSVLINQNKAGAHALEELETLRRSLAELREAVARTGQHGVLSSVPASGNGPLGEIGANLEAKRLQLLGFFGELRERVRLVREEVEALRQTVGATKMRGVEPPVAIGDQPGSDGQSHFPPEDRTAGDGDEESALARARASLQKLSQLATVLILESGRAGGADRNRINVLLKRFEQNHRDLEGMLAEVETRLSRRHPASTAALAGPVAGAPGSPNAEESWKSLVEGLEALERRLEEVEAR